MRIVTLSNYWKKTKKDFKLELLESDDKEDLQILKYWNTYDNELELKFIKLYIERCRLLHTLVFY
jgi:hypothetical protein